MKIIFLSRLNCAMNFTYVVCGSSRYFSCKENYNLSGRSLIMLGFVRGRFVNYKPSLLSTRLIYVTTCTWNSGTEMAISLLHFTAFFQGEDNSIDRDENHYKSGHVESFNYADGENVGLVHASRREWWIAAFKTLGGSEALTCFDVNLPFFRNKGVLESPSEVRRLWHKTRKTDSSGD